MRVGPDEPASNVPWVTKLPKFLPTMQCHVAPLRLSNCALVSTDDVVVLCGATTDLLFDVLRNVLDEM
jgi:hypothetical protein